jgi:uncharacterized membrane protein
MRESLDPWAFVFATYLIAVTVTVLLVAGSWLAMRAAERRRDEGRRR